jgi:hypothetical protein
MQANLFTVATFQHNPGLWLNDGTSGKETWLGNPRFRFSSTASAQELGSYMFLLPFFP